MASRVTLLRQTNRVIALAVGFAERIERFTLAAERTLNLFASRCVVHARHLSRQRVNREATVGGIADFELLSCRE